MLQVLDTPWRYPLTAAVGALGGLFIGLTLATIFVMAIQGDDLATFDLLRPWIMDHQIGTLGAIEHLVWALTLGPALALSILGLASVHRMRLTKYDQSHFQTQRDLKRAGLLGPPTEPGFIYGKMGPPQRRSPYLTAPPSRFPHALMIAPTGRGKGVGFVIPNLLKFQGSAIVLDVKGEAFARTSAARLGHANSQVYYVSPFDYQGSDGAIRTHRFNPLARIAELPAVEQQYTAINTMADHFLAVRSAGAESFFQAGRDLFVASCLHAIEVGEPTIAKALLILSGGGAKQDSYRQVAAQTAISTVREVFLARSDEEPKILDSYVSVLRGAGLGLWQDPAVARATSASDFDFATFRTSRQTLYIVIQPEHLTTLAPLVRLLFADAIAHLQASEPDPIQEPHPVMFVMDEFDQLGHQPLVLKALKTIRSYNGRFFIISQSVPGLESIYGETDRRALQAGAGVQLYMTPQDDRTASVLSSALGKRTIMGKSQSQSTVRKLSESANMSLRSEERPLLSPAEVLRFPLDRVLVLTEGQYPIITHHIRYFEDRFFAPLARMAQDQPLPYPATVPRPAGQLSSPEAVVPEHPYAAIQAEAEQTLRRPEPPEPV